MDSIKPLDGNGLELLWTQILLQFVQKEEGKGLSANDLTDELLQKIQSAGTSNFDGDYNSLIGQPAINGITLTGNKTLDELGVTKAITEAIGNVTQISFEVLESFADLPINGEAGVFYLTPNNGGGSNNYDEWIWNPKNSMYELIGSIQSDIELSNYYTKAEVDELLNKTPNSQSDCAPVGTIISYMGINAPSGYLACNGAVYNISQYPELSNHFNNNFGNAGYFGGNGTSTFAVPDLRGEFLRGTGTATRNTGTGEGVGVHQGGTEHLGFRVGLDSRIIYAKNTQSIEQINVKNEDTSVIQADIVGQYRDIESISNNPVIKTYTSRPTNTSVLYCIKHQTTFKKKETKYLINTDTIKLIADETSGMCYLHLNGYLVEKNGEIQDIPDGYQPTEDVSAACIQTQTNLLYGGSGLIRIFQNGKTNVRCIGSNNEMDDEPVGNIIHGQVEWVYKEMGG